MTFQNLTTHALLPAVLLLAGTGARAAEDSAPLTKAQLEQTIRTYLLEHPELISEMSQALEKKMQAQKQELTKAALANRREELLADAASPVAGKAGHDGGTVTIVEFFDYRCGYCKRVNPTVEKLVAEDPSVRVVFKELPILGPESSVAAAAALAAHAQGGYLKFHKALMGANDLSMENIARLATEAGLDAERLKKDMAKPEVQAALAKNRQLAEALSIQATPSFVVGGEIVPGAMDEAGFKSLIARVKAEQNLRASR